MLVGYEKPASNHQFKVVARWFLFYIINVASNRLFQTFQY